MGNGVAITSGYKINPSLVYTLLADACTDLIAIGCPHKLLDTGYYIATLGYMQNPPGCSCGE